MNFPCPVVTVPPHVSRRVCEYWPGNFLEQITAIVVLEIFAGLTLPRVAAAVGVVYIIGRALYTSTYDAYGGRGWKWPCMGRVVG